MNIKSLVFVVLLGAFGCKDDVVPMAIEPSIKLISVAPSTVRAFADSLVFNISYTDGDGDLGENNSNAQNLFIKDNRINITYNYRINQLSPAAVPIQGTLSVVLKNTGITDQSNSQQVSFDIFVRDRAGHESNKITTNSITIIKN